MARHIANGDAVSVVVVTRGDPAIFSEAFVQNVRQEFQAAMGVLGVSDHYFLDFPAPKLDVVAGHELADSIGQVIRQVGADSVYLPHRGDIHADHQAVFQATLVAARPINNCPVRRLLCYETLSETEWAAPFGDDAFIPTLFVDIADYLPCKLEAMACYRSQLYDFPHPRSATTIEALARLRGATAGLTAAEAFMLIREIEGGETAVS
jgi:LmbE family N-acetylglucosaminyl deacetylase